MTYFKMGLNPVPHSSPQVNDGLMRGSELSATDKEVKREPQFTLLPGLETSQNSRNKSPRWGHVV